MAVGTQFQCMCTPPFQGPTCADQDPCQPNPVIFYPDFVSIVIYVLILNLNFSVKMVVNATKWVMAA
jgi:hypothetical protein